jgi:urease accessory protein
MTADPQALLAMALFADARLPSGGQAQLAGLEPAVLAGLGAVEVPDFIAARLATVVRVDAGAAVLARRAALGERLARTAGRAADADPAPGDGPIRAGVALWRVWVAWSARTAARTAGDGAGRAGRGYRRLLDEMWPSHPALRATRHAEWLMAHRPAVAAVAAVPVGGRGDGAGGGGGGAERALPRPLTLGVAAACAGLDARAAARLVAYDDVATITAARLKLLPADPLAAVGWIHRSFAGIEGLAEEFAGLVEVDDLPSAGGAPWAESPRGPHAVEDCPPAGPAPDRTPDGGCLRGRTPGGPIRH